MKKILTLLAFLPIAAFAQMTWQVNVGGSTIGSTAPYYSPSTCTINTGDIVRWSNVSGNHNVNGNISDNPGNPQSFSSGNAAGGAWNYQFTFTIPGVYHYHCTQDGHAATQSGAITVLNTTGIARLEDANADVKVFPVPTSNSLFIEPNGVQLRSAAIMSLNGELVLQEGLKNTGRTELNVAQLPAGNYFVLITDANGGVTTKSFSKE